MNDLTDQTIDRYHILEQIGEGGMAVVYKAYDIRLEREVAIKIIRKEAFPAETYDQIFKRFEREAKSLAKLSHPNIIKVYDYGEYDGSPYLVMEYQPGGTLKAVLGKPLSWQDCIKYVLPIAQALAYAHQLGIIHRDIKPSNILISNNGLPMLSDFGIAKLLESDGKYTLTGTGVGIGTPEYMAPEQGLGKPIDARVDIYALGVVLYEMVTGRTPYQAETPMAVIIAHISDPLPNPREYIKNIPKEVECLLIKSMAKAPENRYQTMNEFDTALNKLKSIQYSNQIDEKKPSNTEFSGSKNGNGKSDKTIDEGILTPSPEVTKEHRKKVNRFIYPISGVIVIAILLIIFFKYDFVSRDILPQSTQIRGEIAITQASSTPDPTSVVIAPKIISQSSPSPFTPTSESTIKHGNVLFADDFESGQKTDWSFNGFWKIVKDENDNSVLQREGTQIAYSEVGSTNWKNYIFNTRVKVIEYGTGQYNWTFSIGFRSNCREYCPEYDWAFQKAFQNLGRVTTGWKELMVSDYNLPLDTWIDLRLEVMGNVMRGYVNDEIFFETTDTDPLLTGNIRLIVEENAKVWFDDVKVTELITSTP